MLKHLAIIFRILWYQHILGVFWGDHWWCFLNYWGTAPWVHLQMLEGQPAHFSQYYSEYWYHTRLVKNRFFSIYIHGGFCHIEIELYFTPKWRTLQFFIKTKAYEGLNKYRLPGEPIKKTTLGRFFNTFTNRRRWYYA